MPKTSLPASPPEAETPTEQVPNALLRLPRWKKHALFACSCMLQFLLQFDVAAVAVTMPKIAREEKAPQVKVFALATGYCLAQTVFQLVFSHLSQALGRKLMYLIGLALYFVGTITAACHVSMDALIGARVIQGIGAAGMFTMSAIVIVEMTQPRQRAGWTSISQAFGALGNICGPVVAGAMFKRWPWNSIFIVEAITGAILLGNLFVLLPCESRRRKDRWRELKRCDWLGMGLFFASSIAILVPINIGGTTPSTKWRSVPVLGCFGAGFVSLVLLIAHQWKLAKRPAFPREVFTRWSTTIAFIGSAVCGILLFTVFYSLVLFWEGVREKSTVQLGIVLLSVTLAYPVAFAITGIAIRRWGRIRYAIAAGAFLSTLGLGLMQIMDEHTPEVGLLFICAIAGAGCGIFAPSMVNAVIATTDSRWHPHAIATRTLLYTAGQCIGVSLGMAIFTGAFAARFKASDGDAASKAVVAQTVLGNPQALISRINELKNLAPGGELVNMVIGALRWVWAFACVLAGITGAFAIGMNCPDLPEDSTTQTVPPDEEQQQSSMEMTPRP